MAIAINELEIWHRKALIVDDSRLACAMLRRMLIRQGFAVELAGSAGEALGKLRLERPDVVFLDHWMEGLCGLDVLHLIKSNPCTAGIPVVMFTSQESDAYTARALAAGAFDVLPKRVDGIDLPHLLRRLGLYDDVPDSGPVPLVDAVPAAVTQLQAFKAGARRDQRGRPRRSGSTFVEPPAVALFQQHPLGQSVGIAIDAQCGRSPLVEAQALVDGTRRRLQNELMVHVKRVEQIWHRALIGVAAAIAVMLVTLMLLVAESVRDLNRIRDGLAEQDRTVAASSPLVDAPRFAALASAREVDAP